MAESSTGTPRYSQQYLDEYSGNDLISVAIAFTVVETVFVTLRFAARWVGAVKFAIDDVLVFVALIVNLGINGVAIAMVTDGGVGRHIALVSQNHEQIVLWTKFRFVESVIYLVAVALPKLAILFIYYRVFTKPIVRAICIATALIITGNMIACCVAEGLACQPFEYFWNKTINGHCIDITKLYVWASFPNIVTDVIMLILPLPCIWRLQLATHVKVGLTLTFLTASIGLVASCFRFVNFYQINPLTDGTWASVTLMIWSIVEAGAYLIAACLCTLRPLFIKFKETSRHSLRKASSSFSLTSTKRGSDSRNRGINKTTTVDVDTLSKQRTESDPEMTEAVYQGHGKTNSSVV